MPLTEQEKAAIDSMPSKEYRAAMAKDQADWIDAMTKAGLSRAEALQVLCKPVTTIQNLLPAKGPGGRR